MTIGIIGLGYVGLTVGIVAADRGIVTYGVETDPHIQACLANNHAHFFEPGLDNLIRKHNNKTFFCVKEFPAAVQFDAFIITVGTPLAKDARQPNIEYITSALQCISHVYTGDELVVLRSTVAVGTTRGVAVPFLSTLCGRPERDILASMCPERTVEGNAIAELTGLPQIVGGNNAKSVELARALFGRIAPELVVVDSLDEAELVKLYCNTYRDMTFAIGNALCMAAQEFGADGASIIRAANEGYARSRIALPGFVAGPCLEKDAYILTSNMPDCPSRDLIHRARRFNESLEDMVIGWVERKIGAGSFDKTIALSGMAFKGTPETSDLRGSSAVNIARKLAASGYALRLHDYMAIPRELEALRLGRVCATPEEACDGVRLLLVLNNHRRYADLEPFDALRQRDFAVLDCWGACRNLHDSGVRVTTLGTIHLHKECDS